MGDPAKKRSSPYPFPCQMQAATKSIGVQVEKINLTGVIINLGAQSTLRVGENWTLSMQFPVTGESLVIQAKLMRLYRRASAGAGQQERLAEFFLLGITEPQVEAIRSFLVKSGQVIQI